LKDSRKGRGGTYIIVSGERRYQAARLAAWLIEKDLSEFYDKMAHQTTGMAQEALSMLSRWEKAHEVFFRTFRDKLSDAYSTMPWGG